MSEIIIVEYSNQYARSLAEMWNQSGESWGGDNTIMTEEGIIQQMEGSSNKNIYLALDGEEVVGFCSYSEYAEDEGAMYIPLLNARPDYHGKGVGKALVLKAVKRTIELGWPRLDLYTWSGNTKAVPLYKKCGFFWERKDDATHLMNFIPTVINTEAVAHHFQQYDWYKDSIRVLENVADGRTEKGFDYYEYLWEKDGKRLRVEFERKARGLRLIETEDYLISAEVEAAELVFGRSYKVSYKLVNKSGKPLVIEIKGRDDKNIGFSLDKRINVAHEEIVEASFKVGEIDEEQNLWRTHPAVCADIWINGKQASFKVGVLTKYPVKLKMSAPNVENYKNTIAKCYIDLENSFDEDICVEFTIKNNEKMIFLKNDVSIELKAKQKISVEHTALLKEFGIYKDDIEVKVKLKNGETICFTKPLKTVFKGRTGIFGGELEDSWVLVNGSYSVILDKSENEVKLENFTDEEDAEAFIMFPKLGKPFSSEFSKKRPYKVEFSEADGSGFMKAYYASTDFNGITLISIIELSDCGILKKYYTVVNDSEKATEKLYLNESIYFEMYNAQMPYKNNVIQINDSFLGGIDFYDSALITENWIFIKAHKISKGISWGSNSRIYFNNWHSIIENPIGKLDPGESMTTQPLCLAYNAFDSWQQFREYALNGEKELTQRTIDNLEILLNDGNPFAEEKISLKLKEHKQSVLSGRIEVKAVSESFDKSNCIINEKDELRSFSMDIKLKGISDIDFIKTEIETDVMSICKENILFRRNESQVITELVSSNGYDVLQADNGKIKIKAATGFSNSIFSMKYKDEEWLDSSFPTPTTKSWWSFWTGGMEIRPEKLMLPSIAKEEKKSEFVTIEDNFGCQWRGIKTSLIINDHDKYKGLKMHQYYVMQPGTPLMCYTAEIEHDTGWYMDRVPFWNFTYLNLGSDLKKGWYKIRNSSGDIVRFKCGRVKQDVKTNGMITYGSDERNDIMMVYTDFEKVFMRSFVNNAVTANRITGRISSDGRKTVINPVFYIFAEKEIPEKVLEDLKNIKLL